MSPRRAYVLFVLVFGVITIALHALRLPFLAMPVGDAAFYTAWVRGVPGALPNGPFWFAPGFPLLYGVVERLTGGGALALAFVQLGLLALATFLTVTMAERWFDRATAWLAGLLLVASAGPLYLVTKPLPEMTALTLTVAFLALAFEFGGRWRSPEERRQLERLRSDGAPRPRATRGEEVRAGIAGMAGGGAALVLPWIGYAVTLVGAGVTVEAARGGRGRTPLLWFLAGLALAVAPVTYRNARDGAVALVATGGGFEAWLALDPASGGVDTAPTPGSPRPAPPLALRAAVADSFELSELGAPLESGHRHSWWSTRALKAILSEPGGAGGRMLAQWRRLAAGPEPAAAGDLRLEQSRLPWLSALALPFPALLLLGLAGLTLAGGWGALPRGFAPGRLPAVALLVAACAGAALSPDPPRLRVVLAPLLALFGGHALRSLDRLWSLDRRRALLLGLIIAVGAAVAAIPPEAGAPRAARAAALYLAAGNGFEAAGRDSAARVAWIRSLEFDPTGIEPAIRLSQSALRRRDLAGAIAVLESAARRSPGTFEVHNNLGILYHQALRDGEAERELASATLLRPGDPGPWFYRGLLAQRGGHHAAADSFYATALARDPRFPGGWIRRVENQLEAGRPVLARAWADSAARRGIALPAALAQRLSGAAVSGGGVGN